MTPEDLASLTLIGTVINAFANVATIVGVIILWNKEEKTKHDVTDLAVLAKQLVAQNDLLRERIDLQLMELKAESCPLWTNVNTSSIGSEKLTLSIPNDGGVAWIHDIKYESPNISFKTAKPPKFRVKPKTELVFDGTLDGPLMALMRPYKITFTYSDKYGYAYVGVVEKADTWDAPKIGITEMPYRISSTQLH